MLVTMIRRTTAEYPCVNRHISAHAADWLVTACVMYLIEIVPLFPGQRHQSHSAVGHSYFVMEAKSYLFLPRNGRLHIVPCRHGIYW